MRDLDDRNVCKFYGDLKLAEPARTPDDGMETARRTLCDGLRFLADRVESRSGAIAKWSWMSGQGAPTELCIEFLDAKDGELILSALTAATACVSKTSCVG